MGDHEVIDVVERDIDCFRPLSEFTPEVLQRLLAAEDDRREKSDGDLHVFVFVQTGLLWPYTSGLLAGK